GGGRAPGSSPSVCSVASSSPARGARSSELEARRCSRPRASASHTPTARPPRVTSARRRTSCHSGSGPRERAGLIESRKLLVVPPQPNALRVLHVLPRWPSRRQSTVVARYSGLAQTEYARSEQLRATLRPVQSPAVRLPAQREQ